MKRLVSLAILLTGPALALGQQEAAYRDKTVSALIAQLVDEDPEAAANILRNWIGQAS